MTRASEQPRVSVVIPCRNEADTIERLLLTVLSDTGEECEVLVADGGSTDDTRSILERLSRQHSRLHIIDKTGGTAASLNRAIRASRGRFVLRMDVHSRYASDYVEMCVRTLEETGADNVGGPQRADMDAVSGAVWRAIAFVHDSPFSVGGATLHHPDYEGPTDAVAYGCWRREIFDRVGYFDEAMWRNQDGELDGRILKAGGLIWQTPRIRSWYRPRPTLRALFHQYVQYGYWKAFEVRRVRGLRMPRQIVPAAFVAAVTTAALFAPFSSSARDALLLALAAYALFLAIASASVAIKSRRWLLSPLFPSVFGAMQVGYGTGFLCGVWDFWIARRTARESFRVLTR